MKYRGYTLLPIDGGIAIYAIGAKLTDTCISTESTTARAQALVDHWLIGQ